MATTITIPAYLLSNHDAVTDICYGTCPIDNQVKQAESGRWYITMFHPGFNSPANNRSGYATSGAAIKATRRYGRRG